MTRSEIPNPFSSSTQRRTALAREELGYTGGSARARLALCFGFLLIIFAIPTVQLIFELRHDLSAEPLAMLRSTWQALGILAAAEAPDDLSHADYAPSVLAADGWLARLFKANRYLLRRLQELEDDLRDHSLLSSSLRPLSQQLQTELFGVGNEKTLVGRRGWLFFHESIGHLTGRGFLEPRRLRARRAGGDEWQEAPQADPVLALLHLRLLLERRGIELVVMPVPVKPALYADEYVAGLDTCLQGPLENPSWAQFMAELAEPALFFEGRFRQAAELVRDPAFAGLAPFLAQLEAGRKQLEEHPTLIYDPARELLRARCEQGVEVFLKADLHWRPEAVRIAARGLAATLRARIDLPPARPDLGPLHPQAVEALGDLGRMLGLPEDSARRLRQRVVVQQVIDGDGLLRPDPASPVLLVGDSFTNIFSLQPMDWGEGGGLGEHLGRELGLAVDVIARNDRGAYQSLEALNSELARGRDRLAGKRVVVFSFSARELSHGDWRLYPMDLGPTAPSELWVPAPGHSSTAWATLAAISHVPRPTAVAYKDHLCAVHLVDLQPDQPGVTMGQAAVAYMVSMRDSRWTQAPRLRLGDRVHLRLSGWDEARLGSLNRSDLADFELEEHAFAELIDQESSSEGQVAKRASWPEAFGLVLVAGLLAALLGIIHRRERGPRPQGVKP